MSYDIKFKQRAVEYQREGHTYKETCKVFKISETTLTRWINKEKEGKLGEVKIQVRKPKKIYPEKLIKYIEKHPDAYLVEIAEEFNCSECNKKSIKEIKYNTKKKTTSYKEQCKKVNKYLNDKKL